MSYREQDIIGAAMSAKDVVERNEQWIRQQAYDEGFAAGKKTRRYTPVTEDLCNGLQRAIDLLDEATAQTLSQGGWRTDEEIKEREALQDLLDRIKA